MDVEASSSGAQTVSTMLASSSSRKRLKLRVGEDERAINSNLISKDSIGNQVGVDEGHHNNRGDSLPNSVFYSNTSLFFNQADPLQNPVVLTNLFEFCPLEDLARFRLVCRDWRDLSLKAWRTSATLKLEGNVPTGEIGVGRGAPLNQFINYMEGSVKDYERKPFRRMRLIGWAFNPQDAQIEQFWNLTGRYLTSLDLDNCDFQDADEFWKITHLICPNLNRLCLRNCLFGSTQNRDHSGQIQLQYQEPVRGRHGHLKSLVIYHSYLPASWLELLSHFQSLSSLDVKGSDGTNQLLNAIKAIRKQDGNSLPLENVDLPQLKFSADGSTHEKFLLIRELNFPLKSVLVSTDYRMDLDVNVLSDILELHSGTLETLALKEFNDHGDRDSCDREELHFPCPVQLEKLQTLTIRNLFWESIEILKSAPNLVTLSILGDEEGGVNRNLRTLSILGDEEGGVNRSKSLFDIMTAGLLDNTAVLLPKVTKLTYLGCLGEMENLVTLTKLMPNVEELKITLINEDRDQEFAIVCENWKRLKVLTVTDDRSYSFGRDLTDEGLTGGSIQLEKADMRWVHKAVRPNITDLKDLRSFSCGSEDLTGISVYHGFLQLPNLQTLSLSSEYERGDYPHHDIITSLNPLCFGDEARTALRERGIKVNFMEKPRGY